MDKRPKVFNLMPILVGAALLMMVLTMFMPTGMQQSQNDLKYSQILELMEDGKVTEFYLDLNNSMVELTLKEGTLAELELDKPQNQSASQSFLTGFLQQQPQSAQKDGEEILLYKFPYLALFIDDFRQLVDEYKAAIPDALIE